MFEFTNPQEHLCDIKYWNTLIDKCLCPECDCYSKNKPAFFEEP